MPRRMFFTLILRGSKVMFPQLHKTPISSLLDQLNAWGAENQMSRETIGDEIVTAHETYSRELVSKIVFQPNPDEHTRMYTNAVRIYRWFDDAGKDKNLLTVNFLPSVLLAMPIERRNAWLSEYLRPLGLGIRELDEAEMSPITVQDICDVVTSDAVAAQALSAVLQNPTPAALEAAREALSNSRAKKKRLLRVIEGARKAFTGTKAFIGRMRRQKEAV
jgi:hypothetical protein